ncbi:hypothetical protein B5G43_11400 [Flavonifractor sp. An92]|mgnify:CR=1 FL=1|uniref:DUF4230 domain-containing protein n=1 Tax=Flavonifractor sp. An92 TaxID=1965666 RepID=UPI000B38332C|nr:MULTISPECIES: DUF4230 domain-containing protein [unclassified Flavonifractor]OUN05859.1 hypothetical protein B5G43_11400 [Flavonifractor sp. An92]OUQ21666.1 hypothetical protein B5E80_16075 [Flavonifractor sp. An135]
MSETTQTVRRFGKLKRRAILVLILIAVVAGAFFLGGVMAGRNSQPQITSSLLGQRLSAIQELATQEYHYTNMGRFQNQLDFYGWKVPFTTKSFIVAYDGVIKAGVDLSELQVEVSGKTISVTLPEGKILSHDIDEESIEVFDETKNIFNPIQIEDYTGFTADQKASMEERAISEGLLTAASERARTVVEEFITALPGAEDYTIRVS